MTNQEIFELMSRFDQSGITTFKLTTKDVTLELSKGVGAPSAPAAGPAPATPAPTVAAAPAQPARDARAA